MRIINEGLKSVEELFQKMTKIKVDFENPKVDRVKQGRYILERSLEKRNSSVVEIYVLKVDDGTVLSVVELDSGKEGLSMDRRLLRSFARNIHEAKAVYTFLYILGIRGKFSTVVYEKSRGGNKIVVGEVLK